jgi:quinoprotein glucose dehydrogenase
MASVIATIGLLFALSAAAETNPPSVWDGVYTEEQAERGKLLYDAQCAACHGAKLVSDDEYAPDLSGYLFTSRWIGVSIDNRFQRIQRTMPQGRGGTLEDQQVLDIIAYIFLVNEIPAGESELLPGEHLAEMLIDAKPEQ